MDWSWLQRSSRYQTSAYVSKQSQLSLTPEGAELISVLSITNLRPEICLKGYFFP